jgi:CubicO group peptidase (beta-lactamase class C family)
MKFLLTLILFSLLHEEVLAQVDRGSPRAEFVSGGAARILPKQEFKPTDAVRDLISKPLEKSFKNLGLLKALNDLVNLDTTLALLVLEGDAIVFESYRAPASHETHQAGFSMSKSVVAYTLAFPFCEGKINSLSDKADVYSHALKGTVYGDASIENILTMRSGARKPASNGLSRQSEVNEIWSWQQTLVQFLKEYGHQETMPGVDFNYYNNNTQALVEVMNSVGGFENIFREKILNKIGLEAKVFWMKDRENNLYGGSGLMMTARDWSRLALYFADMSTGNVNVCISNFMKLATTAHAKTGDMVKSVGFKSYGYQTWLDPLFGSNKGFWLIGAGGQHIAIEPNSKKILVLSSHGSLTGQVDYVIKAFTALVDR